MTIIGKEKIKVGRLNTTDMEEVYTRNIYIKLETIEIEHMHMEEIWATYKEYLVSDERNGVVW